MTGLRAWTRDGSLPGRAGDVVLRPLDEDELLARVAGDLPRRDGSAPVACRWSYARWKPGVSLTSAYEVGFADGLSATIVARRFATSPKLPSARQIEHVARALAEVSDPEPVLPVFSARGATFLWPARADRRLPGLRAAGDLRHLRRLLDEAGLFEGRLLSRRRSQLADVRYRPESRGVLRLDACLKPSDGRGERLRASLAVRCLPPPVARRVAVRRRRLGAFEDVPALIAVEAQNGLLLESWLDMHVPEPDVFEHAHTAGAVLARLHARTCPARGAALPREDLSALDACFRWDADLAHLARPLLRAAPTRAGVRTWVHGDLHPDQVARRRDGRAVLLDLDALHVGDPLLDLASWIADHLAEKPGLTFGDAASSLLAGYAEGGGPEPDRDALRAWTVHQLVRRAAACVRRLEQDAPARACGLLERAAGLVRGGAHP